MISLYRPPPAQAQAQPAQAQAQAQLRPPLLPEDREEVVGLGSGLVRLVTPLVNPVRLPMAPAAKAWVPLTTDEAKFEPGRLGT